MRSTFAASFFFSVFLLLCSCYLEAQPRIIINRKIMTVDRYKAAYYLQEIPFKRRFFHEDKIEKELKRADAEDGKTDGRIEYSTDTARCGMLTRAILGEAAFLQIMIENMPANGRDSVTDNQERIRCLNALYQLLSKFNTDPDPNAEYYQRLVRNLHEFIIARNEDLMGSFVVTHCDVYTLTNGRTLFDNYGFARAYVYARMGRENPKMMVRRLAEYADDTFAAAIISADARLEPDLIFNYATSTNAPLTRAVHDTKDKLVQAIVNIADNSRSSVKAMSFLSDLYYNRKTIEEIDNITDSADSYFENLIRLRMNNDSLARDIYMQYLSLKALKYIREMNELHESTDAVRFKCLEKLNITDMYYVIVMGQEEIYTSSFLGTFRRLLDKMKPLRGDQLFGQVNYDHFRTFIRMCAGYNTLSDFLSTMTDTSRTVLMTGFIGNLQKGRDDDLEGAVDVADAFGSITDSALASFLQNKVKENYEQSFAEHSKKGMIIYSLLARLFEGNRISSSDTGAEVVSKRIGLPNINKVAYKDLLDDSGFVYQQVFFFGDEDGLHSYEHFTDVYRKDPKWKIVTEKYWTTITSTTGNRVVMYANQPLPTPQDDEAIDTLSRYLAEKGIKPTIMIHRGHSYHLPVTLTKLGKQVKIVILGSCGGYQNLSKVLDKSPDAHIVSSKQTGTMSVNDEILRSMNNSLVTGEDINWIIMWRGIEDFFNKKRDPGDKDKFSDYVPPYKNLGAIFIKAYRHLMTPDSVSTTPQPGQ